MVATVELAPGTEDNGFASMLAGLIRQNLDDHPKKQRDFERMVGRVAMVVEDAEVAVTLHFQAGRVRVHDGIVGIPDVTVRGPSEDLMQMSLVELEPRTGLPDIRKEGTKSMLKAAFEQRVRTYGLLTSFPLVARLTRVLSVY